MKDENGQVIPYLLGLLSATEDAEFEAVLDTDPEVRNQLSEAESLLVDIESTEPEMSPDPALRARVLDTVSQRTPASGLLERLQKLFDLSKERADDLFTAIAQVPSSRWRAARTAGIHLLHLEGGPSVQAADCGLVHLQPGTVFPHHEHVGDEWALVLQGNIEEVGGRSFGPGDIAFSPAKSQHALRVVGHQAVVLAVVAFEGVDFHTADSQRPT